MKKFLVVLLSVVGIAVILVSLPTNESMQKDLDDVAVSLAEDGIKSYNIAIQNGQIDDAYAQASMVASFYLQAEDNENYKKWKAIENKLEQQLMDSY